MGNNRKYSNKNNHDRAGLKIQHSSLSGKTQVAGQQGLSFSEKLVWEFAMAAGTKCHKLSGFDDGHVLSRRSGGRKSEIEVLFLLKALRKDLFHDSCPASGSSLANSTKIPVFI